MPTIFQRSGGDLSNLESGIVGMDHLFDKDRFVARLKVACPQMRLYDDVQALKKRGIVTETKLLRLWDTFQWPGHPVFSARSQVAALKALEGEISLIPFGMVMQY